MIQITVVIPSYNSAELLPQAIQSVLNQNYKDFEILVVDDGSQDNTREVMQSLSQQGKIRYFFQENAGAASARNTGITQVKTPYVAFLDADDEYLPDMLSKCINALETQEADLVSVDNYLIYQEEGKPERASIEHYEWIEKPSRELFLTFMRVGAIGGMHKAVFRREVFDVVGLLDTSLEVYEDLDFWIRVAHTGLRWAHIREPLLRYYRRGSNGLFSSSPERTQHCRLAVLRKHMREAIRQDPSMKIDFSSQLWNMGRSYILTYRSYLQGVRCLIESLGLSSDLKQLAASASGLLGGSASATCAKFSVRQ